MEANKSRASRLTVATNLTTRYARAIHGWAYVLFSLWCLLLFIFTVARLVYTLSPRGDTFLNHGEPFYESTVVELLVCSILGLGWAGFMVYVLRTRKDFGAVSSNGVEVVVLTIYWFLFVGGAGSATSIWPNLNFCVQFSTCRVLQAMMGWAWLGWITVTLLLFTSLFFSLKNRHWNTQVYQAWQTNGKGPAEFPIAAGQEGRVYPGREEGRDLERDGGEINAGNYEFERWKRAVTWLQDGNAEKEQPVASTSAV